jgi:asparagine synthetase B (glutamine-hydrolysing)
MQIKLEIKNKEFKTYNDKIDILFDGYIIPRNECFDNYKHLKNEDLIFELYNLYKEEFIHHLKGIFYIIIKTENQLLIFTDRLGLKKIYYQIENEI